MPIEIFIIGSVLLFIISVFYREKIADFVSRGEKYEIVIDLYANNAYGTEFTQNPDYDKQLEGPSDGIKQLITNIDNISLIDRGIYQVSKFDSYNQKEKRRASLNFKIIVREPESLDLHTLLESITEGIKEDDRHSGIRDVRIMPTAFPSQDIREKYQSKVTNDTYESVYNDKLKDKHENNSLQEKLDNSREAVKEVQFN